MDADIKFLYDKRKIYISKEICEKLKYITRNYSGYKEKLEITQEINMDDYYEGFRKLMFVVTLMNLSIIRNFESRLLNFQNQPNYNKDLIINLIEKYKNIFPEYAKKKDFAISDFKEQQLLDIINISYQIHKELTKFNQFYDLVNAYKNILLNMKYFASDEAIDEIKSSYQDAIAKQDIEKMQTILNLIQDEIKKEWKRYLPKLEDMTSDNFTFLGHSTHSTKFTGDFYGNYVSTSLFTPDLHETFWSGFGFIFSPINIVGASSFDMWINNYAQDENALRSFSIVPKIDHPKRLIEKCLKLKQTNILKQNDAKVYNEVVIKGFNPIGIFCFTDGSLSFDSNYEDAKQLQKSFPNLKIYNFDIMKGKSGTELENMQLKLINKLRFELIKLSYVPDITKSDLGKYDYFLENFQKLKATGQYSEEDIVRIFNKNQDLLSIFNHPKFIFNGKYNAEEIKYILGKNQLYNIDSLLSGKATSYTFNNLAKLLPYKEKLNSFYTGLGEFVELVSKFTVTEEMILEINNIQPLNFSAISKYLILRFKETLNLQEKDVKEKISNLELRYNELLRELKKRINLKKQSEYYFSISKNEYLVSLIKIQYQERTKQLNDIMFQEKTYHEDLDTLNLQLVNLHQEYVQTLKLEYEDTKEHLKYALEISENNLLLKQLLKHPFLNRKKIATARNIIKDFQNEEDNLKRTFQDQKEKKIKDLGVKIGELNGKKMNIEFKLNLIPIEKDYCNSDIISLNKEIKEKFKCNSFAEIEQSLSKAKSYIENYSKLENEEYLMQIELELKNLKSILDINQNELTTIQTEKEKIARSF